MSKPLAFVLLAAALAGCGRSGPGRQGRQGRQGSGYADPAACRPCHADIARSYESVAMARSFGTPASMDAIEDFTRNNRLTHEPSGFTYDMLREGGRLIQRRSERGPDGRSVRVFEREATFAIGSGRHARSYLHREPTGEMTLLPVTWYTQEKAWGMSPGYDRPDHPDFLRPVTFTCLFCHDAYPDVEAGRDSPVAPQLFPAELPSGIDCQRCHGPGEAHVLLARSRTTSFAEVRGSIVNPARLPPERQLDICMQCHLETTSSGNWSGLVAFGRGVFSFRPGDDLAAYMRHFDHPPGSGHEGKFEIAHQAYRLRQSACFKGSAGRMTCTTCHDPHRRPEDPKAFFAAKCLGCHQARECAPASRLAARRASLVDCVPCHMPPRRTDDVIHVVMTDHFIRREHPASAERLRARAEQREAYRGPIVFYRDEEIPAGPERDLVLGVASLLDDVDRDSGLDRLQRSILALDPKTAEPHFQLGLSLLASGKSSESAAALERAAALAPGNARIKMALGNALAAAGRQEDALRRLEEAIAAWPEDSEAYANAGNILAARGRAGDALRRYEQALAIRPDDAQARANRGVILSQSGREAEALADLHEALRIRPGLPEASLNLAALLLKRGDAAEAVATLRVAARRNPAHASVLTRLAWILATSPRDDVRDGRESIERADRAVRLTRRSDARALDSLAAAMAETGRMKEAVLLADEARALASSAGQADLAAAIAARRLLYEKGVPYRDGR